MIEALDTISQQIWDDSIDDSGFEILRQKALMLTAQIAVHQTLQNTVRHLRGPQNSSGLLNTQSRLGKFIDVMYGNPDNEKNEVRWQKLRNMDCATFLFIAVSYTPLEITKMHRTEFDYLVGNASKLIHIRKLPPRWIFRKEIQIAIAGKADLEKAATFRKEYHALEFKPEILGKGQPEKQNGSGHQLPNSHEPDDQSNVSGPQDEAIDDCHSSATTTGAGVILASIKEVLGHGEDGAQMTLSPLQPRKRRHIKRYEQEKPAAVDSLLPYKENREMKYMYTNAPASNISKMPEPFRAAVQNSQQWKSERSQGLETTGCWPSLFPRDNRQDVSFTIWCGNKDGAHLTKFFGGQLEISLNVL